MLSSVVARDRCRREPWRDGAIVEIARRLGRTFGAAVGHHQQDHATFCVGATSGVRTRADPAGTREQPGTDGQAEGKLDGVAADVQVDTEVGERTAGRLVEIRHERACA